MGGWAPLQACSEPMCSSRCTPEASTGASRAPHLGPLAYPSVPGSWQGARYAEGPPSSPPAPRGLSPHPLTSPPAPQGGSPHTLTLPLKGGSPNPAPQGGGTPPLTASPSGGSPHFIASPSGGVPSSHPLSLGGGPLTTAPAPRGERDPLTSPSALGGVGESHHRLISPPALRGVPSPPPQRGDPSPAHLLTPSPRGGGGWGVPSIQPQPSERESPHLTPGPSGGGRTPLRRRAPLPHSPAHEAAAPTAARTGSAAGAARTWHWGAGPRAQPIGARRPRPGSARPERRAAPAPASRPSGLASPPRADWAVRCVATSPPQGGPAPLVTWRSGPESRRKMADAAAERCSGPVRPPLPGIGSPRRSSRRSPARRAVSPWWRPRWARREGG